MSKNDKNILLTFDVEEFDLPLEYGINISPDEQMATGAKGLEAIHEILVDKSIACTLFTTANFALNFPAKIARLSEQHEIASHTYYHSSFHEDDLRNSLEVLEDITSKKVFGLRMPRMKQIDTLWIKNAGYRYESSMNPTWIPGRYNNLLKPRTLFIEAGIPKIPVSVSPNFRIPLFWLAFKNFPYSFFKNIAIQTLKKDGYLSLYFHPWEFTDLSNFDVPAITKRKSGNQLLDLLQRLIDDLKEEGSFITMNSFLDKKMV
ncbi:MAG: polysaccharide deacetylase family protein [Ginsengibacter sp.]